MYRLFREVLFLLAALFALGWAVARASVQSITIDEADTYLFFASKSWSGIWAPSSNNHILNTLLMWLTTHFLGTSAITVRAPALLGAALYIAACYFLCRRMTGHLRLFLPIFICLTYNPLVADFMVAARGYGLANGLLMTALAIPVWAHLKGNLPVRSACILASLALGLSFSANFSFAFVNAAACLAITIWALRHKKQEPGWNILGYCALPGLAFAALLCAYPLLNWRADDSLGAGAHSLGEVARNLMQESLYQLNPHMADSALYAAMNFLKPLLFPSLAVLCLCQFAVHRIEGSGWNMDWDQRWVGRLGVAFAAIAGLSLLMHLMAFRFLNLPLPLGRKAIYLVPLLTLTAGVVAAAPVRSIVSRWLRRGMMGVFVCLACYFLLCLRLSYFKEWQWGADTKDAYAVLADYNHRYGVADVGTSWYYTSALNFYRVASQKETFAEFRTTYPMPVGGKSIYVLNGLFEKEFIDKEKLVVVFKGKLTDLVVAARPVSTARLPEPR